MRIEHIAMWVRDLEKAKEFYQKYFHMKSGPRYENPDKNFTSYFLYFDSGSRLELMHRPDIQDAGYQSRCFGFTHMAFSVGNKEEVDHLTERLRSDGYTIYGEPRTTGDGYYESVVLDTEGNSIEITE